MPSQRRKPLSVDLAASDPELSIAFRTLATRQSVARILEIPDRTLRFILYVKQERADYTELKIPKKNGKERRLCVPPKNLMILQWKLLRILSLAYSPKPCVCGFTKGKSIVANAVPHVRARLLLNFDLEDFFPSIHVGRVEGMLKAQPYSLGVGAARTIAQIVCHHDGHLPQGAPTSPIVANMVCGPFDTAMTQLAREHRLVYTRYADDITLSTTRGRFPEEIASEDAKCVSIGTQVAEIVRKHKFLIRDGKTRLRPNHRRQRVTGLTVNEFVNAPRNFIRELRALLHWVRVHGLAQAASRYAICSEVPLPSQPKTWISNVIRGKIGYLAMIRGEDDHIVRQMTMSAISSGITLKLPRPVSEVEPQPIRGLKNAFVDWRRWIRAYGRSVFRLRCRSDVTGKDAYGTAFVLCNNRVVTAGHNVVEQLSGGCESTRRLFITEDDIELEIDSQTIRYESTPGKNDLAVGLLGHNRPNGGQYLRTQFRIPQIGEQVAAIGFPYIPNRNPSLVLHTGIVESSPASPRGARFITGSFSSGPGLSGAPLVDANGCCVGIMVENTFEEIPKAPFRPYGQAIAIGHLNDLSL